MTSPGRDLYIHPVIWAEPFSRDPKRSAGDALPCGSRLNGQPCRVHVFGRLLAAVVLALLVRSAAQARDLPPPPAVAPPLTAAPSGPTPPPPETLLRAGETLTLRVLQVIPADGLSPGERLLNSRNPILPGDRFLAEAIDVPCNSPVLVGGVVVKVVKPGWFGRPGYVTLQLAQFVETGDGKAGEQPWQVNTEDRQIAIRLRRAMLSALLGLDGLIAGASLGAQLAPAPFRNPLWVGGGAASGLLLGLGYSSLQRGPEANLEPGDTFHIVVGSMEYKPVAKDWQTILYPAADPTSKKGKR
jgi:hypothetical protein